MRVSLLDASRQYGRRVSGHRLLNAKTTWPCRETLLANRKRNGRLETGRKSLNIRIISKPKVIFL